MPSSSSAATLLGSPTANQNLGPAPVFVDVDGVRFGLSRIVRRRRVAGLLCEAPPGSPLPPYGLRRRIRAMLAGAYSGGDLTIFTDSARSAEVWSWSVGGRHSPARALERLRRPNDTESIWDAMDVSRRIDQVLERHGSESQRLPALVAGAVLRVASRFAPLLRFGGAVARLVHEDPGRYGVVDPGERHPQDLLARVENAPQLLQDALEDPDSTDGLRAIWRGVLRIRIIDPNCGRGDWLLGVAGALERVYLACLEQMRIRLADELISPDPHPASYLRDFRVALSRAGHDDLMWVREAILLENLHAMDPSPAAAAVCRRRLGALLGPDRGSTRGSLPHKCLSVSAGTLDKGLHHRADLEKALRGEPEELRTMSRILGEVDGLGRASRLLRRMRLDYGATAAATERAVDAVRGRRKPLADELDRISARVAGVDPGNGRQVGRWLDENRPLHLLCEWPQLDRDGGFDLTREVGSE